MFVWISWLGCDAEPTDLVDSLAPSPTTEEPPPPPPPPPAYGPAVVIDDLHIAGFLEEPNAFSFFGLFLDPLIAEQIASGALLLGLDLQDLDDPTLRDDDALTVRLHALADDDGDPADNFVAGTPETFSVVAEALVLDGVLAAGVVTADGAGSLDALGTALPLPVSDLSLEGTVVAVDGAFQSLEEGRLRGAIGASLLALSPNLLYGTCPGATLLDVMATGCGLLGFQPDADLDGDGLESLYDDDDDGAIDRCVDGDGTELLGTECPFDPAIADGYTMVFVIHGVAAVLIEGTATIAP